MKEIIEKYHLTPHPEGGWFRETHRSGQRVVSLGIDRERAAVTHIYFLLTKGQMSRFHKVIHDEVWNFYEGAPLKLIRFDGKKLWEETIGPGCAEYAAVVGGGVYQAAEPLGEYSLMGCTVAPGFEFRDFSFLEDLEEDRNRLVRSFPEYDRFL